MSDASETHNRLAGEMAKRIIVETACAADALVVVESILFGVLLAQAGTRAVAIGYLDLLTERGRAAAARTADAEI